MLVKTEWYQAGRIILQVFSGNISLAEMEQGWTEVSAMLNAERASLPVHLVLDFSLRESYSPELFKLPTMRHLFELSRENANWGWFLVVQATPNPIMLFTSTLAARLIGRKFRIVGSVEEALRYLHYSDSSLIQPSENP